MPAIIVEKEKPAFDDPRSIADTLVHALLAARIQKISERHMSMPNEDFDNLVALAKQYLYRRNALRRIHEPNS